MANKAVRSGFVPGAGGVPANAKYPQIVAAIKRAIVQGRYPAGTQLPSAVDLAPKFRTTKLTMLAAIRDLVAQGFLRTEPRAGTFVVKHPPHLTHFALTFPFGPRHMQSQFYTALHHEAQKLQRVERRITSFYDIEEHVDVEDYQRLLGFVREQRVAGVIFANHPHALLGSPLLELPGVPRVTIMQPVAGYPFPTVYPALEQFVPRALDRLAELGRRRVAFLSLASSHPPAIRVAEFQALATARGLIVYPDWVQATDPSTPLWAEQVIRGFFHRRQTELPDALVVTDDNLVPVATAALQTLNVRVPADVTVVVETNFPWPTASAVPVIRLGFDIGKVIATCLVRIDEQRRSETPPAHTVIPALFESEYVARQSQPVVTAEQEGQGR